MTATPGIDGELGTDDNQNGSVVPEIEPLSWRFWRKRRYIVVVMAFFGLFNVHALRVILSVGIVAMSEIRTIYLPNGTITHEQEFAWDSKDRGLILSSFFWGYIMTAILGGWLGSKYGGNHVFGVGVFMTSVLTLLVPVAAKSSITVLVIVRLLAGVFDGVTFPCTLAIWSRWAPPLERSRMATTTYAGNYIGTVVSMSMSGILVNRLGWESLFYIFGTIGCVWYLFWILIVRESPAKDKHISKDELRYIEDSLSTATNISVRPPWMKIFTSKAVFAICSAHFAENWGFYTMLTQLPSFLKDSLGFELEKAGFLAGAPYLVLSILLIVAGYFADVCQIRGYLTTTQVRRYFNCGGFLAQTVFLMAAGYVLSPTGTITCIIIAIGIGAVAQCGYAVNNLDIAPQHASVLMGISNTFSQIPGIVSPVLTGYIVVESSRDEWQIVFMIASGVYLIGCVIYWIWASGEVQPWAQTPLIGESNISNNLKSSYATTYGCNNKGFETVE